VSGSKFVDVDADFLQSDEALELPEFMEFARGIKWGSSGLGADCAAIGVDPALRCVLNCGRPGTALPGAEGSDTEAVADLQPMPRQIAIDKKAVAARRGARTICCMAFEAADAAGRSADEEAGADSTIS